MLYYKNNVETVYKTNASFTLITLMIFFLWLSKLSKLSLIIVSPRNAPVQETNYNAILACTSQEPIRDPHLLSSITLW